MEEAVRVRQLRKDFGDLRALDGVSFRVARVEAFTHLADLGQRETSAEQSAEVTRLLGATDELGAIGDVVEQNLVRLGHRRIDERIEVSPSTVEVLGGLLDQVTATSRRR